MPPRTFEEPGGGGAVAAVQLMKLAGERHAVHRLRRRRDRPSLARPARGARRSRSRAASARSRSAAPSSTSTTTASARSPCSARGSARAGADPLAWDRLDDTDAVYLTAGDVEAVRHARRARVLVATPRGLDTLSEAHVELDALVSSGRDPGELLPPGRPRPRAEGRGAHAGRDRGRVGDRLGRARQVGSRAAARSGPRRLRRRRQLRGRPHLRPRRRLGDRRGRSSSPPAAAPPA